MKNHRVEFSHTDFFSSCSSNKDENSFSTNISDVNLYNQAMIKLKKKDFEEAIEIFTELEIQYPYSPWAARDNFSLDLHIIRQMSTMKQY